MDKNLHDIEDLFRKALEDNEENPSQKAWDGVEKKLDKDNVVSIKKKYDSLKKVALLLIFLLVGLSIYVWKSQDKNSVKTNKDIPEINKETESKNNTLTEESDIITLQKPFDSFNINQSNNPERNTNVHKIIDKTILNDENVNPKKSLNSLTVKNLPNTSIPKNKINFKKRNKARFPNVSKSDASKFSILQKDKLIKGKSNEILETKIPIQIEVQQPMVENPAGTLFGKNLFEVETLNPKNIADIESNTVDIFATKELVKNTALAEINPIVQIEKTIFQKPSIKPTKQSRFAITGLYSPDITFYHFENNDRGISNNANFGNTEAESYSFSIGALVDYNFSENWGLQSGITLATSNFILESETLYAQPDNSGGIKYKLNTPSGDAYVLPSFSSNPNIGDSIFSKSTTHTLQYLGIPLALKYNFGKGKFTLNAVGGIAANFLTRGSITTELESGNNNETESTDKIHGLKQFYFSGLAGMGLDYKIYKNFSLSFSPTFRFAFNDINSNVQEKSFPKSIGLVLGVKMKL